MRSLGVITAKSHSTGIPNKNMALCAGLPLIYWTLEAATRSRLDDVAVLSDGEDILDYSRAWDVTQVVEPECFTLDDPPGVLRHRDAFGYAIKELTDMNGPYDTYVLLQSTSPLRQARHIDEGLDMLAQGYDSVIAVCASDALLWSGDGHTVNFDFHNRPLRQHLDQWQENGAFWACTQELWDQGRGYIGGKIALYKMEDDQRLDINTPLDLKLAGEMLKEVVFA